ncbi:hypothetical protein LCM20_01525 [Halobacillus litoralis]|nr:hypothetical protein [Halobacillus litoralis]MCA0969266.1 hypothetical protein [Halobacillus litoralis]
MTLFITLVALGFMIAVPIFYIRRERDVFISRDQYLHERTAVVKCHYCGQ